MLSTLLAIGDIFFFNLTLINWGYSNEQNRQSSCLHGVYILLGETSNKKINKYYGIL